MASKVSFASPWVALTWPYQIERPELGLASRTGQQLADRLRAGPAECGAGVLVAAAGQRVGADVRQVDADAADVSVAVRASNIASVA